MRRRQRVDWDEELRKTERIRRKGLFISGLTFGVALLFIFGAGSLSERGIEFSRKIIFTFCFVIVMFLARAISNRRSRLREDRLEKEEELELLRLRQEQEKKEEKEDHAV